MSNEERLNTAILCGTLCTIFEQNLFRMKKPSSVRTRNYKMEGIEVIELNLVCYDNLRPVDEKKMLETLKVKNKRASGE